MGVDLRLSSRDLERTTELMTAGLPVRLSRPGRSGPKDHPFEGRCYFIDNTVDETTSTFLAKATIPNPGGKLLPGEYVKVRMVVDRLDSAVVVPAPSVIETDAGPIVHVVDKDGKVAVRPVIAGQTYRGLRVIVSGLDTGASVIVEGLQMIRPGLSVKTEPAALTPRGGRRAEGLGGTRDGRAEVVNRNIVPIFPEEPDDHGRLLHPTADLRHGLGPF